MLAEMDSRELTYREVFESVEPGGGRRGDLQTAQILAEIRDLLKGAGDERTNPVDLTPDWWGDEEQERKQRARRRQKRSLDAEKQQAAGGKKRKGLKGG